MELNEKVKKRRLELNMTQEELAKKMGYSSRVSINKIEMGRPVSQKIIVRLAEALDTNIAYLMGWEEKEPAAPTEKELLVQAIVEHVSKLTPDQIRQVIQYAQFLAQNQAGV